jgi:putative cell wall-binding protein
LAGLLNYPLLLSQTDQLSPATADAIRVLASGTTNFQVIIIGSEASISAEVEAALADLIGGSEQISRLGGPNRYATAHLIYYYGTQVSAWSDTAIVASGANFPDALAISPYAVTTRSPLFLTDGSSLYEGFDSVLSSGAIKRVVVVGGTPSVSAELYQALADKLAGGVIRLAGANRYATCESIVRWELEQGMSLNGAGLTTGQDFPDALTGSVLLGKSNSVLMLANEEYHQALSVLAENSGSVNLLRIFGGPTSVTLSTRQAALDRLGWDYALLD